MNDPRPDLPQRIFAAIFIGVFGCIGITILIFMWGGFEDGFGEPPLFFRIFASFIAIAFIASSAMGIRSALRGKPLRPGGMRRRSGRKSFEPAQRVEGDDYSCPNCGSGLETDIEISPSGDVKCPYCKTWFNVRRS